jgi:iron complex transport system substrate-binding protein
MRSGEVVVIFRLFFIIALIMLSGCAGKPDGKPAASTSPVCNRIVSFAPSITETLFALGLGDRIVGVTRYCLYPPEAQKIAKVGGYVDPNFEMILGLKPDLVLMLREHGPLLDFLKKNSINYKVIINESLSEIINSFSEIASLCDVKARGDSLVSQIKKELLCNDSSGPDTPDVLICVGRNNPGSGQIAKFFAAGPGTFYDELIRAAGGKNACADSLIAYPELSAEAIVRMKPDVIFDLMAVVANTDPDKVISDWHSMLMLPAVKAKHVYALTGDYATIPGPRILNLLRDLRKMMNKAKEKNVGNKS